MYTYTYESNKCHMLIVSIEQTPMKLPPNLRSRRLQIILTLYVFLPTPSSPPPSHRYHSPELCNYFLTF